MLIAFTNHYSVFKERAIMTGANQLYFVAAVRHRQGLILQNFMGACQAFSEKIFGNFFEALTEILISVEGWIQQFAWTLWGDSVGL